MHFGAVDYRADVWLNKEHLGRHEGGYDPFDFDVTGVVKPTGNRLVVRVHDDPAEAKPREKIERPKAAPEIKPKLKEEKTVEEIRKEKARDEQKKITKQKGFLKKVRGFFRRKTNM